MEIPPRIPRRPLKVSAARASPSGAEITIHSVPAKSRLAQTRSTCLKIMSLGTGLIACFPTWQLSPAFVTSPIPTPPFIFSIKPPLLYSYHPPGISGSGGETPTRAQICMPWVTSGSSPPSLRTAQLTQPEARRISSTLRRKRTPPGVSTETCSTASSPNNMAAAAMEAAAAQVPVVYPHLNFFCCL